ncbi:LacI family transcriptional regulator [Brevibacterium sediminis]|uniref:LacI family DNA-binding transcriptional regulator n=1 Tax=Brevibacterium TaxID=1696 RepID=UPI0021754056|nr:LacI family DNA-binding transcriptional regulator [Brevibacterium sediminis]MCS4594191.1 LacI family transcriptional regulator [Brevibacterium sediminis]
MSARDSSVVTLRDVAERAGVSVSTVSRALDERMPTSKSASAARIREIAQQIGYRRNVFASSLRRGETAMLGVVVPRLTDAVMALMFEAIERASRKRGHYAVVATSGDDPDDERLAVERLLDRNVDGLILANARIDDSLPAMLRSQKVRHSLVLRTDGVSPSSLGDDFQGGYFAVRHLLDLGHRSIAIVTGPDFTSSANDRVAGARAAAAEARVEIRDDNVIFAGYGVDAGIDSGKRLLESDTPPTAIFAANDNLAIGISTVAAHAGKTLGHDLSIVGYNDIPLAEKLPVPLTTVRVPFDQIAETGVGLLFDEQGMAPVHKALPVLIPRRSTAPPVD